MRYNPRSRLHRVSKAATEVGQAGSPGTGKNHGAQSHHPSSDYFIPFLVDGKPIPTTELWSRIVVTQPNEKARCVCQYVHPTPPCPASASTARDDGKANSPMMMDAPPAHVSFPPARARPRVAAWHRLPPSANMIDGQKCSRRIDRARHPSLPPPHPFRAIPEDDFLILISSSPTPAPRTARPSIHSSLYLAHPLPLLSRCFRAWQTNRSIHLASLPLSRLLISSKTRSPLSLPPYFRVQGRSGKEGQEGRGGAFTGGIWDPAIISRHENLMEDCERRREGTSKYWLTACSLNSS